MGDRRVPRSSVRLRITVLASVVTAVAVAVAGWLLIRSVEDTQVARLRDRANESLDLAAARLSEGTTWDRALTDLPSVVFVTDDAGTCVASNPSGTLVFRCAGDAAPSFTLDTRAGEPVGPVTVPSGSSPAEVGGVVEAEPGTDGGGIDASEFIASSDGGSETMTRSVDTERYGPLSVTAIAPVDTVARGAASVGKMLWILFPGLVGVVALVAWWLTGRALQPVEAIRTEAEAIGATSLHRRVPAPDADDEIGRLARTMNAMLDRLDRSAQRQRQFVSDASHELRSPIAAIRTDLEVALTEGVDADWSRVARDVLAEEERLEVLVADLLVLAADDESPDLDRTSVTDLRPILIDEVERSRRTPVTVVGLGQELTVAGTGSRLRQVFANVLDNAARHAESTVEVSVAASDDDVIVDIDDDGDGIREADRERVFERFARLDDSRARDHGGAGLGLAVVASIVDRFGGDVTIEDSPLGGARFTIRLPRPAAQE